jgi:hypothetical protein
MFGDSRKIICLDLVVPIRSSIFRLGILLVWTAPLMPIFDCVVERGRLALEAAEKLGSADGPVRRPEGVPKRSAPKLWAAFVLSGAGTAK